MFQRSAFKLQARQSLSTQFSKTLLVTFFILLVSYLLAIAEYFLQIQPFLLGYL